MTAPWKSAPAPSSQFSIQAYVGELLLVAIGGVHEHFKLSDTNIVPAARINVVVLTGPEQGREWTDAMMFGVITVDQARAALAEATARGEQGSIVLGRVRARRGNNNRDMYYIDNEISQYDDQVARGWDAAFPGKLLQLRQQAVLLWQAEESKQGTAAPSAAPQAQAAPPPPPPPPPPPIQPAQTAQEAPAAAPPPWGTTPQPAPVAAPAAAPPPWPVAAPAGDPNTPPF